MMRRIVAFFEDDQDRFHAGRFCGALYLATLLFFSGGQIFEPLWLARATFTLGWCLAFGRKEVPSTFAGMVHDSRHLAGLVFVTSGLAAQFYITRRGFSVGTIVVPILIASLVFARGMYKKGRR
jgi:hypothetical protein